jgi:Holliday junction resolvasome RuvABC endonuclease subunit
MLGGVRAVSDDDSRAGRLFVVGVDPGLGTTGIVVLELSAVRRFSVLEAVGVTPPAAARREPAATRAILLGRRVEEALVLALGSPSRWASIDGPRPLVICGVEEPVERHAAAGHSRLSLGAQWIVFGACWRACYALRPERRIVAVNPTRAKRSVTGYGSATKASMIRLAPAAVDGLRERDLWLRSSRAVRESIADAVGIALAAYDEDRASRASS